MFVKESTIPGKSLFIKLISIFLLNLSLFFIRFLPLKREDALTSGNVKPGFVVDREIVSNFNEFYLCSHFGGLGTSRPTR